MKNASQQKIIEEYYKWIEYPYNNKYKTWHNKLCEMGFEVHIHDFLESPIDLSETPILQSIEYRYMGDFAIDGDHASDFFVIFACLSKDKVIFYYNSSYIDEIYMGNYGLGLSSEDVPLYLNNIKNFIEKNNDYIGKIDNRSVETVYRLWHVYFCYSTDNCICMSYVVDRFTKLAILLDLQSRRKFPFCGIRDYESIYGNERDFEFFLRVSSASNGYTEGINHLIGSSYSQQKEDVLLRVEKLAEEFFQDPEDKTKALLSEIFGELKKMSIEEFNKLKDCVFDL